MDFFEILKIAIPALLVLLTAYILIDRLLKNEDQRRNFELAKKRNSIVTPIKLRAYERFMLVIERTTPETIIINTIKPGMKNFELQTQLLMNIREEFGHNVSQQIYISNELWNAIRITQNSLISLVNSCASNLKPEGEASELAERILQVYDASGDTPTDTVSEMLKKEARNYL